MPSGQAAGHPASDTRQHNLGNAVDNINTGLAYLRVFRASEEQGTSGTRNKGLIGTYAGHDDSGCDNDRDWRLHNGLDAMRCRDNQCAAMDHASCVT
jgi:hypothetical protein